MRADFLGKSTDPLRALDLVSQLLGQYTKEGSAEILNLISTGNCIEDLAELSDFTVGPCFQARGWLTAADDWRRDVALLLVGPYAAVSLAIRFDWGQFAVSVSTVRGLRPCLQLMRVPNPEARLSREGRYISRVVPALLPLLGAKPGQQRQVIATGQELEIDAGDYPEGIEQLTLDLRELPPSLLDAFVRALVEAIEEPKQLHAIVTADVGAILELHASGRLTECVECCTWHYGFACLMPERSTVKEGKLQEAASFLTSHPSEERLIRFTGFEWTWDGVRTPRSANAISWILDATGSAVIEIESLKPLPRTALDELRAAAVTFLDQEP